MRSRVSYSKDMREFASAHGKELATVDVVVEGTRFESQGPVTPRQASFLMWASVMCSVLPEDRLPDMERMYKRRRTE